MATFALELALFALFSSVKIETKGAILTSTVHLHTIVDLPCMCPFDPESTAVVQWYRISSSDDFIMDEKALASWSVGKTGGSEGFGIKDDFALIMYNVKISDEGLYRCIVTPLVAAECTHDVKLDIYAKPDSSPFIEYIRQTDGFNVTCSISNVFPRTFPILTSKDGTRSAYNNSDGTFNTAVTHLFPANKKDTTIDCLYSNLNFKSIASLHILGSDTIAQNTTDDTDNNDCRPKPSGLWMVWIILIIEVIFFIAIIVKTRSVLRNLPLRKTTQNNEDDVDQDEHLVGDSQKEEPANSARVMLFSKRTCAVISLTVKTIVFLLLVAYLSTAKCSNEPDVKLEGDVPAV